MSLAMFLAPKLIRGSSMRSFTNPGIQIINLLCGKCFFNDPSDAVDVPQPVDL
jgi:hypothetical protein